MSNNKNPTGGKPMPIATQPAYPGLPRLVWMQAANQILHGYDERAPRVRLFEIFRWAKGDKWSLRNVLTGDLLKQVSITQDRAMHEAARQYDEFLKAVGGQLCA